MYIHIYIYAIGLTLFKKVVLLNKLKFIVALRILVLSVLSNEKNLLLEKN